MFRELRYAVRALARWRSGLAVAVLTLAIGIGSATTLYALVTIMLADFPGVPEIDRVGRIYASSQALGIERSPVALNEFEGLSHATSFAAIGAYARADVTIGSGADEQQVTAGYASPAFFRVMRVAPATGRLFSDVDADASQPGVLVSEAVWRKRFADRDLTNASLSINGIDHPVVGVMPAHFSYGFVGITADVWMPLVRASRNSPATVVVFARLRPSTGWPAAADELRAMKMARGPWTWRVIPILEDARSRAAGAYTFTLGPAIILLLIACVNVACLLLARGIAREQELSVRRALGATRARIVRQLLLEHLLLAFVSGAIGCALAVALLRIVGSALAAVQPALAARIAIDVGLLPTALGASVVATLLFGVLPAVRLSRRDVAASLNGLPAVHRVQIAGYGARDLVVFAELGSAVGLVVFAAMLLHVFGAMRLVRPAFPADRVVAMRVAAQDVDAVAARVAAIPGVTGVTVSSAMPGSAIVRSRAMLVRTDEGRPVAMSGVAISAAFLETLGIPLVRGRSFDPVELRARAAVAILSESAARALSPASEIIGTRIHLPGHPETTATVIGVCRDAMDYGQLSRAGLVPPDIYVPFAPALGTNALVLARVTTEPKGLLRAVAAAAGETPAGAPPPHAAVVADEVGFHDPGSSAGLVIWRLLSAFALVALLLAGSGVFSVISQSVAQRTREFGIRLALGATPHGVLRLVVARETKLIGAALVSGAFFVLGLTRALFVELAIVTAKSPSVWIALVVLCGGVAAVSVGLATYRIVRLEPAAVLRRL